ncbi:M23 family metallopeptidase [soil metagenome]
MSFVMIATGSNSSSKVRTWSFSHLMIGAALAGFSVLAAGVGIGYGMARSAPVQADHPESALSFAVDQIAALSARLFTLESQAAQLSQRVGVPRQDAPAETAAPRREHKGSGGPMIAPLQGSMLERFDTLDGRLVALERSIARVSDAAAMRQQAVMRMPSRLPIAGPVELASTFGTREDPFTGQQAFHAGLDFAADKGTPIVAAAGGTITFAGLRPDFGRVVEIDHGGGLTTRYAHTSRLLVRAGDVVMPGEAVALVGSTGRSTGPHLHFEVLRNGEPVDPRRHLAGL